MKKRDIIFSFLLIICLLMCIINFTNSSYATPTTTIYTRDELSERITDNELFLKSFPVGSIYITTNSENPGDTYGGTWVSYGDGRTIIGSGTDTDTNNMSQSFVLNSKGGEYNHQLTIDEMPSHQHDSPFPVNTITIGNEHQSSAFYFTQVFGRGRTASTSGAATELYMTHASSVSEGDEIHPLVSSTGSSQSHNNLQPYIVVNMWKRTA